MSSTLRILTLLTGSVLGACALPPANRAPKGSASAQELTAVSLAREGSTLLRAGRPIDAELKFRQALYLEPRAMNVKLALASALERNHQGDESVAIYREVIGSQATSYRERLGLARALSVADDDKQSITEYTQAFNEAVDGNDPPSAASAARSLSVLNFTAGREEEALCWSQMAYQLKPDKDELVRHLKVMNALGLHEAALALIQAFLGPAKSGGDGGISLQYALAAAGVGQDDEALQRVKQATAGNDPEVALSGEAAKAVLDILKREGAGETIDESALKEASDKLAVLSEETYIYWPARMVAKARKIRELTK